MNENRDIVLRIDRKSGTLLAGVLAVVWGGLALSEQLTLTTSYPVPSGIYNQLITTGNSGSTAADTTFNRNAGNTILVPSTNASGKVGIGTTNPPASKFQVVGGIQMGDDASSCTADKAGTLRYNSGAMQLCNGTSWSAIGSALTTTREWEHTSGYGGVHVIATCPTGTQAISGGAICSGGGAVLDESFLSSIRKWHAHCGTTSGYTYVEAFAEVICVPE